MEIISEKEKEILILQKEKEIEIYKISLEKELEKAELMKRIHELEKELLKKDLAFIKEREQNLKCVREIS